jgi:hypothetical protein
VGVSSIYPPPAEAYPAEEAAGMQNLNQKSPDELKEEQEEEFLDGAKSYEHRQHEHH